MERKSSFSKASNGESKPSSGGIKSSFIKFTRGSSSKDKEDGNEKKDSYKFLLV